MLQLHGNPKSGWLSNSFGRCAGTPRRTREEVPGNQNTARGARTVPLLHQGGPCRNSFAPKVSTHFCVGACSARGHLGLGRRCT